MREQIGWTSLAKGWGLCFFCATGVKVLLCLIQLHALTMPAPCSVAGDGEDLLDPRALLA
jgi:hypothetical protein